MNVTTYDEGAEDFSYYVETTIDPGRALNGTVAAVCIFLLVCCLPKFVSRSNEQQRRRQLRNENENALDTALNTKEKDNDERVIPDTDADDSDESYHRKLGDKQKLDTAINNENEEEIEISDKKDSNAEEEKGRQLGLEPSGSLLTEHQQQLETKGKLIQITRASSNLSNASTRATSIFDGILSARSASRVGRLLKSPSSMYDAEEENQHNDENKDDDPQTTPNTDNGNDDDKKKTEDLPDSMNVDMKSTLNSIEVAGGNDVEVVVDNDDENEDDMSELSAYFDLSFLVIGFNRLVELAHWDSEMKALWNLSRPFATQAFIEGFFDLLCVGIIGHVFGAKEANAYVVVMILNKLTNFVNYGFYEALGSLIPDANEAGNEVLIGEYFQVGIFLFTISAIPVILLWSIGTESAFLWLGFDHETAKLGQGFACSYVFAEVIRGVDECLHVLLSFKGKEYYSTFVHTFSCFTKPFAVFVMVERRDLVATGALQLALATCVTIGNFIIVGRKKWLGLCWDGFVGRLAFLDGEILEEMLRTAIPLGISWVLTFGEWELMTLFARYMGPAEVAAWSLLSIVWVTFELITEGFTIATELRVSEHLNNGSPKLAKTSAHKAMLLAIVVSLIITSLMYSLGRILVTWLSPDPTLQRMMYEVLPLLGLGQIVMAFCATCWSVLGSQGRHRIATAMKLLTTWVFVIPFAVILVYGANFNLLGLIAAMVLGCTLRGATNAYLIFSSDWDSLVDDEPSGEEDVEQDYHEIAEKGMLRLPPISSVVKSYPKEDPEEILPKVEPEEVRNVTSDAGSKQYEQILDVTSDVESKVSLPNGQADINEIVEESSTSSSLERQDTVGADTGGAPPPPPDNLIDNEDGAEDPTGRAGMIIDTDTITVQVSSDSSLGGVEDRWVVESCSSESSGGDSDSTNSSVSKSKTDEDKGPFAFIDIAAAAASNWGLFKK